MKDAQHQDRIYQGTASESGDFRFNKAVVRVFEDMIRRSVPGYGMTLDMIRLVAKRYAKGGTRVYDLGCSLGASSLAMLAEHPEADIQLVGVDNSEAMLERCQGNFESAGLKQGWELRCEDILDTPIENASMIVLNFTLQFIPVERRLELLAKLRQGLVPGGVLVLSEKVAFEDEKIQESITELHHDFKRAQGYSDLEISRKRSALEQVLIPETVASHKARLEEAGFGASEVWFQCFNFVSLLGLR